jgi:hypothetical protein
MMIMMMAQPHEVVLNTMIFLFFWFHKRRAYYQSFSPNPTAPKEE